MSFEIYSEIQKKFIRFDTEKQRESLFKSEQRVLNGKVFVKNKCKKKSISKNTSFSDFENGVTNTFTRYR